MCWRWRVHHAVTSAGYLPRRIDCPRRAAGRRYPARTRPRYPARTRPRYPARTSPRWPARRCSADRPARPGRPA
jgi:hypothetical protein